MRYGRYKKRRAQIHTLRAQLRDRIINRITELKLKDFEVAEELGLSPGQMSRLNCSRIGRSSLIVMRCWS